MNPTPIEDGDTQHIDVFDSVLLTIDPHDLLECAIDFHASQHPFLYRYWQDVDESHMFSHEMMNIHGNTDILFHQDMLKSYIHDTSKLL